jgi:transcriptional regulator with XRE-family HTH domain
LRNLQDIIERIKEKFSLKNETQVAKLLNVEQNTLSSWKKRNKIPYDKLDELALQNQISLDWILSGNDSKLAKHKELLESFESLSKEKQEIYMLRIKADALENGL